MKKRRKIFLLKIMLREDITIRAMKERASLIDRGKVCWRFRMFPA
jgi:hypothetical protein